MPTYGTALRALLLKQADASRRELADCLRVSKDTISKWVARGVLPPPLKYSRQTLHWDLQAVLSHLESRAGQVVASAS